MNEIYDLEDLEYRLETTLDYITKIRDLWKDGSKYSDVPLYLEDLNDLESEVKNDIEHYEKEIERKENQYHNSEEYARAEYEDMELDSYRGK